MLAFRAFCERLMGGFDEIATTGSPGLIAALGMGTVFVCLTLLYVVTRLLGRYLPRVLQAASSAPAEAAAAAAENATEQTASADEEAASGAGNVAAAIAIALTRHRASRARAEVEVTRGTSPWKVAGRIRALRDR
jgi:Na+-transporting methylmalonyl-CoA/oxaloacetate decarboxylase gamma subunit